MEYNLNRYQKFIKYLVTVFQSYVGFIIITLRYISKHKNKSNFILDNEVTLVITSCNRHENLVKTLESFTKYNTYNFKYVIHIEDGQCEKSIILVKSIFNNCNLISIMNKKNIGQLNSIDKAYSYVKTEFLFHLEEDWTFLNFGFIEYSMNVLNNYNNVLFVSLRAIFDQNGHPLAHFDENFLQFKPFWKFIWVGFGFNPSLRRINDYLFISKFGGMNKRESGIGIFYYIILKKRILIPKNHFYVKHNGWDVSTVKKYNKA